MSATGIASYWPMFEPRTPGFVDIEIQRQKRHRVAFDDTTRHNCNGLKSAHHAVAAGKPAA
jgi:hypothetical protein